jgi:hypothetical protein
MCIKTARKYYHRYLNEQKAWCTYLMFFIWLFQKKPPFYE